jgi:hypothetical protein
MSSGPSIAHSALWQPEPEGHKPLFNDNPPSSTASAVVRSGNTPEIATSGCAEKTSRWQPSSNTKNIFRVQAQSRMDHFEDRTAASHRGQSSGLILADFEKRNKIITAFKLSKRLKAGFGT